MSGPVVLRALAGFRNEIDAGTHRLIADEPSDAGGTDGGPTPYDFLSAALGSCTAMTIRFLAQRDNIPLEGTEISVTNDRMYAKDCADCMTANGYIHRFTVRIKLLGTLTTEQRERLLSAAKRCPVYKTLTNEIRIDDILEP
ncbi:MAG: putative redox protein [Acidobacteriota bacterium]|jgi:putative redox protein|nr:putative redox protein [Acidobacteriota bacterium]